MKSYIEDYLFWLGDEGVTLEDLALDDLGLSEVLTVPVFGFLEVLTFQLGHWTHFERFLVRLEGLLVL